MTEALQSFGRRLLSTRAIDDCLALEASTGRLEEFADADSLIGDLLVSALRGSRIAKVTDDDVRGASASILSLSESKRDLLRHAFELGRQQERGAWYLPDHVSLKVGLTNLVAHFREQPRFAMGIASEERAKVALKTSADAMCLWASLEPFFESLWLPLELRGPLAGTLSRDEFGEQWHTVEAFFEATGLNGGEVLARFGYGSGWHGLAAAEQIERKGAFIESMSRQVSAKTVVRFRAFQIRRLVERYYAKAGNRGEAERRKVLTKAYQPILSGVFAGDWLAFLKYIGEAPHPNEQIATSLPEPRLYVTGTSKVAEVATAENLPVAEVERMVAAFWERGGAQRSPVEERVEVLRKYWRAFDEIHARQKPGMQSLWGLIEERGLLSLNDSREGWYRSQLYRTLLSQELLRDIGNLWGGVTLPTQPERVVTEIFPHALMAECFGPALRLWHGCALTAWFISEGPSSRTDLAGLEHYHRKDLAELEDFGCPVDSGLFSQLKEVESTLGPPQPIQRQQSTSQASGISITMSTTLGSRRGGFERMRDVITHFRSAWAAKYLEKYLHDRWERELKGVAEAANRSIHVKARPPTLKQFAKFAAPAANHWFGGDLTSLYGAIGEKSPERQMRAAIIPGDRLAFAQSVYVALGGRRFERQTIVRNRDEAQAQSKEQQRLHALTQLANLSLEYLQLQETLGRQPELKDFGESRFKGHGQVLDDDIGSAWTKYADAIRVAMESPQTPSAQANQTPVAPVIDRPARQATIVPASSPRATNRVASEKEKSRSWLQRLFGR